MNFSHQLTLENRNHADILIIPFWQHEKNKKLAVQLHADLMKWIEPLLTIEEFTAKSNDILVQYIEGQPEKRLLLLGLGSIDKIDCEKIRLAYGIVSKFCLSKKLKNLTVMVPPVQNLTETQVIESLADGLLLPNYSFLHYKQKDEDDSALQLIETINWISSNPQTLSIVNKIAKINNAVYYTRDLVNHNADEVTPSYLVNSAQELAKKYASVSATIFDKQRIQAEKMGLLLAVNRGSSQEPAFIILEYKGAPQSTDHTIIVGKGVTYDTGGLNLKPTGSMETMKCDMAGAAACFGVILAAAELNLSVNVTAVVPTTENSIDAHSFKPGDVYVSYLGKSVEIMNTDAEGRLILADALSYACQNLKPTRLIDIATLTGAIDVALGPEASGLMASCDELAEQLRQAGEITAERVWRMPLYDEYKEKLKSDIADLKNWNGRSGSANMAAVFLKQFVEDSIPWAHLDIAGTAYLTEPKKYQTKYATGVGVRLLIELLTQLEPSLAK